MPCKYVSPIDSVINGHSVQYHQYADDLQLYLSLSPNCSELTLIENCTSDVSRWFLENALLLNPTKTPPASACVALTVLPVSMWLAPK